MNIVKNEKGVTLLALTITIIVMVIVTGTLIYNTNNQVQIQKIDKLYSDIEQIKDKVSEYYISNKKLPTKGKYCTAEQLVNILKNNGASNSLTQNELLDSNDKKGEEQTYYVIDLSKMDNLTLNYGSQFKNWESGTTLQDLYIINEKSHQIYYPKGVKIDGKFYYSYKLNLSNSAGGQETYQISNIIISEPNFENADSENKYYIAEKGKLDIKASVHIELPNTNTLVNAYYAITEFEEYNDENIKNNLNIFKKCTLENDIPLTEDNNGYNLIIPPTNATAGSYTLWIRLEDKNGNEVITNKYKLENNDVENQFTIEEATINLTKSEEPVIDNTQEPPVTEMEVYIQYNPIALNKIYYGEGKTFEKAKQNIQIIDENVPFEVINGERKYTLTVRETEYIYLVAHDAYGNSTSSYLLVNVN